MDNLNWGNILFRSRSRQRRASWDCGDWMWRVWHMWQSACVVPHCLLRLWRVHVGHMWQSACGMGCHAVSWDCASGVPRWALRSVSVAANWQAGDIDLSWVRQARLSTPLSSVANAQVWLAWRCLSCLWLTSTFERSKAEDIKMSPRTITQHSLYHYQGSIGF